MCAPRTVTDPRAPKSTLHGTRIDAPHFTGSRLSKVGFEVASGYTPPRPKPAADRPASGFSMLGLGVPQNKTASVTHSSGFTMSGFGRPQAFTSPFMTRTANPTVVPSKTAFRVSKREDGSFSGGITSRVNPETGAKEYGRNIFSGRPRGSLGLFKNNFVGKPRENDFQPLNKSYRKSDTRHLKSTNRTSSTSLRVGSSVAAKRKGTNSLSIPLSGGNSGGINVPT